MPAWRLKRLNSRHGLPAAHVHGWLSAEHRRWRLQAAKMAKSGLEPGDDPHSFALAVPGSHRAGPCDPGGAPHGRREHGRLRWPRGRLRYGLVKSARETPCLLPIEGGSISTNTHCNHSIT